MILLLEDLLKTWETDCVIDQLALDESSIKFAKIHGKYLSILSEVKLKLKKLNSEMDTLRRDKFLYFTGKMEQSEMDARGWPYDPFNGASKPLRGDMDLFYKADPDLQKLQHKIDYQQTMIEALEEILGTLKWRAQSVKNIIDWRRFTSGA